MNVAFARAEFLAMGSLGTVPLLVDGEERLVGASKIREHLHSKFAERNIFKGAIFMLFFVSDVFGTVNIFLKSSNRSNQKI